jgi:hypothetical protein
LSVVTRSLQQAPVLSAMRALALRMFVTTFTFMLPSRSARQLSPVVTRKARRR